MSRKKLNGKIGYCYNNKLGIYSPFNKGHYVYIRKDNGNTVDVNVITSLDDANGKFKERKLQKVRKGLIYPIPKNDSNFSLWSGIDLTPINNIKKRNIQSIDLKKIKRRHKWFIGLFTKKIRGSRH